MVIKLNDKDVDIIIRVMEDTVAQLRLHEATSKDREGLVYSEVVANTIDKRERIIARLRGLR